MRNGWLLLFFSADLAGAGIASTRCCFPFGVVGGIIRSSSSSVPTGAVCFPFDVMADCPTTPTLVPASWPSLSLSSKGLSESNEIDWLDNVGFSHGWSGRPLMLALQMLFQSSQWLLPRPNISMSAATAYIGMFNSSSGLQTCRISSYSMCE